MSVLHFISDLHLQANAPKLTQLFEHYLSNYAPACDSLYILGDLFEVWLGDDIQTPLSETVCLQLSKLKAAGKSVYLLHGNRDFLIGENFCQAAGVQLLNEPHHFEWQGFNISLVHGDSLCTDDLPYQQLRKMVRQSEWQQQFLSQTIEQRIQFAEQVKKQSEADKQMKSMSIMDVNEQAVNEFFATHQCDWLIHGHTHRPAFHDLELDFKQAGRRIVLSDWGELGHFVELKDAKIQAHQFRLS